MANILDSLLGGGWKAYAGGLLMIIGACGLGADYVAQLLGMDIFPEQATTWPQVTGLFGLGLAALGIRHKQDRTEAVVVDTQEELMDDVSELQKPRKK